MESDADTIRRLITVAIEIMSACSPDGVYGRLAVGRNQLMHRNIGHGSEAPLLVLLIDSFCFMSR